MNIINLIGAINPKELLIRLEKSRISKNINHISYIFYS